MRLDWTTDDAAGVTLVTALLSNGTGLDREVRLRNDLDGPVLAPRREGVFEAGWDRDGVTLVVSAGDREAVGYACPVGRDDAADPPVRIEWIRTPDEGTAESGEAVDESVTRARRSLGDPRPPRAVVAGVNPDQEDRPTAADTDADGDSDGVSRADTQPSLPPRQTTVNEGGSGEDEGEVATDLPPSVDTWLEDVRSRVETLEALRDASVDEAATILDERGGLAGVEALDADLGRDEARLRAVAETAERLAERAAETEAPVETLRRLA